MSLRPQLSPFPSIKNGDMAGDIISDVTIIQKLSMMSYTISWDGTSPIGDISLEGSDDFSLDAKGEISNPGTWVELPLSNTTSISGNTGKGFIDILQCGAYAIRLVYTRTSGVGTLQATLVAKVA